MNRIKPDVDIIKDILETVMLAKPEAEFVQSLHRQYVERGGLSKKQLEGLYSKASRVPSVPVNKLATLEAIILKRPTRQKSELPVNTPLYNKDEHTGRLINDILQKYPEHKRVIFLQVKYENNEVLTSTEISDLERFHKLLK